MIVANADIDDRITVGTWHPMGYRLSPVVYQQRINGEPTGLFFVVSRPRYWWIWLMVKARRYPIIGKLAARLLSEFRVEYHFDVPLGKKAQA